MTQVLTAGHVLDAEARPSRPMNELWLSTEELRAATGWHFKPEGLCRDEVCIPIAAGDRAKLVEGNEVHASGLWKQLQRPALHDQSFSTWMLGESADQRARELESLEAPDFTLPDIEGKLHSLSDFRGKKVLLSTWASW